MPFNRSLLALGLLLAACGTLPREAGLQSEVLAKSDGAEQGADEVAQDFAVEPITRDSLGRYAKWPSVNGSGLGWPEGRKGQVRVINPGDMLAISIWVSEENGLLTAPGQRLADLPQVAVSSNGQIFLPYIGQVKIGGQTQDQARGEIEAAYASVASSAQVQLSVTEGRKSSVSVVGGVTKPGSYPLADSGVTVLDMLAVAGGVPEGVENPQVRLQRGERTYGMSMNRILDNAALNIPMIGGDRLVVEKDDRYFLSLGAAGSKAQHHFPQDRVSALDALSIIGGLAADRANAQGILVLRQYNSADVRQDGTGPRHNRTIFTIDLTSADGLFSAGEFRILPGDLIYVTESPLVGTRNILSAIGSVFGLATRAQTLGE